MKYSKLVGAVALSVLLPRPALAAAPIAPIAPTGKWTVDFGEAQCVAMRNYGTADAPLTLAIRPAAIGDVMQMSVVQSGSSQEVRQFEGTMTLDSAKPEPISILTYPAMPPTEKLLIHAINLTKNEFEPVRTATSLRVRSWRTVDRTFALTQMAAVAKTLDRCLLDLRKLWNLPLDAEAQKARDEQPPGLFPMPTTEQPLGTYFKSEDYPAVAWNQRGTGVVSIVLLVDEKGKLATCNVFEASGLASLDAQSCAILKARAKFKPGVDAAGKPVKSGGSMTIRWALPR